jgi:putative oxidoreductase
MKRFFGFFDRMFGAVGQWLQSPLLLVLRLFFGISLVFIGIGKLHDIRVFQGVLESLHIPYPEAGAWATGLTETIGGALLTLGLLSRFASFAVTIVFCVAYGTAHVDSIYSITKDPHLFVSQAPFNFLVTSLLVFAFGPGFFSLDRLIWGGASKTSEIKK